MCRARARPVRVICASKLRCCCPRTWLARDHIATQRQANTVFTIHTALFTPCTSHSTVNLISKPSDFFSPHVTSEPHLSSSHLIPSLLTCHLSKFISTVFIWSEHWISQLISAFLRARKLLLLERSPLHKKNLGAQNFFTQKLETQMQLHRKILKTHFVLQSLRKALPSTTLYYTARTT